MTCDGALDEALIRDGDFDADRSIPIIAVIISVYRLSNISKEILATNMVMDRTGYVDLNAVMVLVMLFCLEMVILMLPLLEMLLLVIP